MNRDRCVAVVGAACRTPAGPTQQEFWEALLNGKNFVKDIPTDRWNADAYHSNDSEAAGKTYVRHGAFLDE